MILIYAYFVVGLFFRFSAPVAAIAIFLYIVSIVYSPDIDPAVASSLEILFVIFLLMGLSAYQKELISRQLYLTETRERERLARQTQQMPGIWNGCAPSRASSGMRFANLSRRSIQALNLLVSLQAGTTASGNF